MALSPQQARLLAKVQSTPEWQNASPRERKALVEAGIVESHLTNLNSGDRDSKGFLQQRPSQGWKDPTNVKTATKSFLDRAKASNTQGGSAGQLAQRVQRSAFPARYDQSSGQADAILGRGSIAPKAQAATSGNNDNARRAAVIQYLQSNSKNPLDLALGFQAAKTDAPKTKVSTPNIQSKSASALGTFEGVKVAGWIVPELKYARAHGWTGKVTSGYRSDKAQAAIYDRGIRPAAKPVSEGGGGSNHSRTEPGHGAIDVTDAPTLAKILKAKGSPLRWAGAKDPVHLSAGSAPGTY